MGILNLSQLKFFADYIQNNIGIVYSESNYFQLEHRLEVVANQLGYNQVIDLWNKARTEGVDSSMKTILLDLATNNETSFFRDAGIFRAFSEDMLPFLLKEVPPFSPLRFWSAAGSTGQEAYSIVMTLDAFSKKQTLPACQFLVTDLSGRVLEKAKSGVYTHLEVQRGLPARSLVQYFEKVREGEWKIKSEYQKNITFCTFNLLQPFPVWEPFHVIFCRNVLIYQTVENKKKVIQKLEKLLLPGGFLVLGSAENLIGLSDTFEHRTFQGAVFYRKKLKL